MWNYIEKQKLIVILFEYYFPYRLNIRDKKGILKVSNFMYDFLITVIEEDFRNSFARSSKTEIVAKNLTFIHPLGNKMEIIIDEQLKGSDMMFDFETE